MAAARALNAWFQRADRPAGRSDPCHLLADHGAAEADVLARSADRRGEEGDRRAKRS